MARTLLKGAVTYFLVSEHRRDGLRRSVNSKQLISRDAEEAVIDVICVGIESHDYVQRRDSYRHRTL